MADAFVLVVGLIIVITIFSVSTGASFGYSALMVIGIGLILLVPIIAVIIAKERASFKRDSVTIDKLLEQHKRTLIGKRRSLCYFDEYGLLHSEKWDKEKDHFFDKVIKPKLEFKDNDSPLSERYKYFVSVLDNYLDDLCSQALEGSLTYAEGMSGIDYEAFCRELFLEHGAEVRTTGTTGDKGADLIIHYGGDRIIAQCKRSGKPIGNRAIQEVASAVVLHDGDIPLVITDRGFTKAAREAANGHGVYAILHEEIPDFLERIKASNPNACATS